MVDTDKPLGDALDDFERVLITQALTAANGNVAEAARTAAHRSPESLSAHAAAVDRMERHMMRARRCAWIAAAATLACASLAARARAQAGQHAMKDSLALDTASDTLSYDDAAEIAYLFNAVAGLRSTGPTTIAAGDSVIGNVAVLWGPLTIAGTVHGSVIVVNGSVTIEPGGHVDKDLIVTGGTATGADSTTVGRRGAAAPRCAALPAIGRAHYRGVAGGRGDSGRELVQALAAAPRAAAPRLHRSWAARTIESKGCPMIGGPAIRQNIGIGTLRLSALGIYRSADNFAWKGENLGWHASSELTVGGTRNLRFGIEGYDIVQPNGIVAAARWRGLARELLPAQGLSRLLQHEGRRMRG